MNMMSAINVQQPQNSPKARVQAPVDAVAPAASSPDRRTWERRLALYRRAKAAQKAYGDGPLREANRAFDKERDRLPDVISRDRDPENWCRLRYLVAQYRPAEEAFNRRCARTMNTARMLLMTPAPELADVATKLYVWFAEGVELWGEKSLVAALIVDVEKFSDAAAPG